MAMENREETNGGSSKGGPLDEPSLRRPDFRPGTPVVLADGQAWELRKPIVWFVPSDTSSTGFRTCLEINPNDDFQSLLDSRRAAIESDSPDSMVDVVGAEFALARRLLGNYELAPEHFDRLLRFGYDEEENPEGWRIRQEIMEVALGVGKKPNPDGSESSHTPSGG